MASHLCAIRKKLHLSQAKLGELAGVSRARIIQVENGTLPLSWSQMTGILFVLLADRRSKEYLYRENVLGPRFLQYMQQKDANIPPQTNVCVHAELVEAYLAAAKKSLSGTGTVQMNKEERLAFCEYAICLIEDLRRVMQMSQATLADLAGISRARLIQLEKKKVRLSWSQMTSILCVCMLNLRAKEYLYANASLPPRFVKYIQQKDAKELPATNVTVPQEAILTYRQMLSFKF